MVNDICKNTLRIFTEMSCNAHVQPFIRWFLCSMNWKEASELYSFRKPNSISKEKTILLYEKSIYNGVKVKTVRKIILPVASSVIQLLHSLNISNCNFKRHLIRVFTFILYQHWVILEKRFGLPLVVK